MTPTLLAPVALEVKDLTPSIPIVWFFLCFSFIENVIPQFHWEELRIDPSKKMIKNPFYDLIQGFTLFFLGKEVKPYA